LCRAGWLEADAKSFTLAVYTSVPGHDPKALARVSQSVEDTYRRFSEGGEITGIPKLSALIDKRAVNVALEWLGLDRSHSATVDGGNWQDQLIRTDRGKIIPCVANALIALNAKEWCGVIKFNESACRVEALSVPPWSTIKTIPYTWNDEDDVAAAAWMQHHGIMVTKAIVGEAIQTVARNHRFHPIREFFDGLTWDGIPRINDWLTLYLGADPSDFVRAVGAKWLIGAVARVFQPGCKMDCCIVLEGPQGIRKSSALRVLAEPWFCDEIADLGSKDSSMQVHGVLVVEIAELDALQKSEVSKVKAFMSRSTDRYRPPYAKYLVEAPRESVFAGSVNPGIKYLKDETGGRRFWPVKCGLIDIETLKRDRAQLWAEAVVRFKSNSTWWIDTPALNQAAEQEQSQRYDTDPWLPKIVDYIKELDSVSIRDILEHCLFVPTERWTRADKNRVAATLRFLGWTDRQTGPRGHREWRYYPPIA
jgi:predicted P-loop ATPase